MRNRKPAETADVRVTPSRAEYQRAYRARRKAAATELEETPGKAQLRIRELEAEIAFLKRLLATPTQAAKMEGFGRALSQTQRDVILSRLTMSKRGR